MASPPSPSSAAPTAGAPVAIVSGANSGIGLAACVALASAGHIVYAGMRAGASADALLAAVAAAAGPATNADGTTDAGLSSPSVGAVHVLRMDVGADASVTAAVASVLAATADRVDVVVANAGYGAIANVEDASVADFEAILNVNFLGALRLVKAALPSMRRRRSGRVVGISSVVGLLGWPFYGPYSASKFAMEGLWESCFSEYKGLDVHFVLVEPGPVRTGVASRAFIGRSPPTDIKPAWDTFLSTKMPAMAAAAQTADECAAYILRAVTDPSPALRYMTHPSQGALLRAKVTDLDGAGAAAALLSMVQGPAGGGDDRRPAEAQHGTDAAVPGESGGGVEGLD
ncbi:hypothetical protein I4F81_008980 [Pyropia yezoensis]|uniref:Uncharacterized protein n=1 Tax=Pyropia yezoensis TaxID=2788 RepID=A0ACC3C8F3_PYRYE|nr:hypothetical protein I4F81_008980 [Neopyropia yezoensis]